VAAAKRRSLERNLPMLEEQQFPLDAYSDICTYWVANPAFDPQEVLLRRLFFLNANKTIYVSVGFYPARDSLPPVEFGVIRSCRSKAIILTDEQVYPRSPMLCARRGRRWRHRSSSVKVVTFV